MLPFFQQNQDFIELFHREAKLAAKLRHSNIVGVIDLARSMASRTWPSSSWTGATCGTCWMRRTARDCRPSRSRSLGSTSRRRSSTRTTRIHGKRRVGLARRRSPSSTGTSPSNVLISRHGEVMLTDFGVAKAITGTAREQSAIKGKIPYMSPEQLRGEAVDGRSDLFALGVVLFEALSGQRPYEGPSDPATILLTLKGEHPSLGTLAPNAPPEALRHHREPAGAGARKAPANRRRVDRVARRFTPARRTRRELGAMARETPVASESLVPDVPSAVAERSRILLHAPPPRRTAELA